MNLVERGGRIAWSNTWRTEIRHSDVGNRQSAPERLNSHHSGEKDVASRRCWRNRNTYMRGVLDHAKYGTDLEIQ